MCPFMRAFNRLLIEFRVFLQSQPESKHPAPEAAKADLLVWAGMLSLSEWLRSQGSRVVRHSDTNFLLLTQQVSRMVKWMMEQVWGASFVFNKIYNTNFRNNVKFNDKKCKQIIHFDCIIFLQSTKSPHVSLRGKVGQHSIICVCQQPSFHAGGLSNSTSLLQRRYLHLLW